MPVYVHIIDGVLYYVCTLAFLSYSAPALLLELFASNVEQALVE